MLATDEFDRIRVGIVPLNQIYSNIVNIRKHLSIFYQLTGILMALSILNIRAGLIVSGTAARKRSNAFPIKQSNRNDGNTFLLSVGIKFKSSKSTLRPSNK